LIRIRLNNTGLRSNQIQKEPAAFIQVVFSISVLQIAAESGKSFCIEVRGYSSGCSQQQVLTFHVESDFDAG